MKTSIVLSALFLALGPAVRFEDSGVRVGEVLVDGSVLELKELGGSALLASAGSIESLGTRLEAEVAPGRAVALDPGLRLSRVDGGFTLSAHGARRLCLAGSRQSLTLEAPCRIEPTAEGWTVGGRLLEGSTLVASLQAQDDADDNLKKMKTAQDKRQDDTDANLQKMKTAQDKMQPGGVPRLNTRHVRLFSTGDPLAPARPTSSVFLLTVPKVSPEGSP